MANRDDELSWVSLVSSMCAERRVTGGSCHDEWMSRSEAKLREANATAQVPAAALWLAARAWALAARAGPAAAPSSEQGRKTAAHRLALAGDLCLPGSVCAELLGDGGKGRAQANESDGCWQAEFAVFRALFIEVSLSPSAHHSVPLVPPTPVLRGGRRVARRWVKH